jgi:putative hydrolase of HD superfamily
MKKLADFVKETNPSVSDHLLSLFEEYSTHKCPEAQFVKSLDLFDMYLQAYEYQQLNPEANLEEFFSTATTYPFESPVKEWVAELIQLKESKATDALPPDSNMNTILKLYLKVKKN